MQDDRVDDASFATSPPSTSMRSFSLSEEIPSITSIELVQRFRSLRVLVIGDAMLDTYLEGTASRLCSEGPVPVVRKTAEYRLPGGAANTAANLRALEADVLFLSVVGRDIAASLLRSELQTRNISDRWLVEDEHAPTLHKLRILADGQYVVRFDEGEEKGYHFPDPYTATTHQRLLANLNTAYAQCDLVLVSDYCYGVLSNTLIARLQELHTAQPKVLLINSKSLQRFRHVNATIVTPNHLEAQLLNEYGNEQQPDSSVHSGPSTPTVEGLEEIASCGRHLLSLLSSTLVAITLAERGVFLLDRSGQTLHLPAHPVPSANDVGAGNSFASALSLALAAGGNVAEATRIAIDAAGIAVTRRWTAVVHHQELLQRVSLRTYANSSTTAHAQTLLSHLLTLLATERASGRSIVFTNGVFDILHAGHVQFLRQAKALGDVLIVGVNSDSSARRLKGANRPITNERDRIALVAALDMVDHVVLFTEDTPTELIRTLRPHIHVKGGDYAHEALPEAEAVQAGGGHVVILPLAGSMSTSEIINRIVALASHEHNSITPLGGSHD